MTALKTNIRLYAGVCPGCEQFLWRYLERSSAKSGVPGVLLRCTECSDSDRRDTTYARPVRSHTIRRDPPWVVDREQVIEWFDDNMVDTGAGTEPGPVAAADGGTP